MSTEWGMEQDANKTRKFLDQAYKAGLKVVMDGGFSARAWGFSSDDWDHLPKGKHPVWQKERVQSWIRSLKDHPAIYAWDICNEFGENLPSGAGAGGPDWPASMITIEQLAQAKADVLAADPTRPILVRMYEWDFDNVPTHVKALLSNKIAGIISLNLYSNYLYKGKVQWPDIIRDAGSLCVQTIKKEAPGTTIWLSVAAFEYLNAFQRPTSASLERDVWEALLIPDLDGISFFCWGPVNQWDAKSSWYLPKSGADLWKIIQQDMKKVRGSG